MEMARTMLNESRLSNMFWPQAVHTDVHILNRILLRNNNDKTHYYLWKGIPASIKHFRIFGSKCYIKRIDKNMGKLVSRTDEGALVGYSCSRKVYKCYNLRLRKIVESIDVKVDESSFLKSKTEKKDYQIYDKLKEEEEASDKEETKSVKNENMTPYNLLQGSNPSKTPSQRIHINHHEDEITGDINASFETRRKRQESITNQEHVSLISLFEPKNVEKVINDEHWVKSMK